MSTSEPCLVAEIASYVGQGWSFAAGDVICRLQVGEADDLFAYGVVDEKT